MQLLVGFTGAFTQLTKSLESIMQPVCRKCVSYHSISLEKTATIKCNLTEEEGERRADGKS